MATKSTLRATIATRSLAFVLSGASVAACFAQAALTPSANPPAAQPAADQQTPKLTRHQIEAADAAYLSGARFLDRNNPAAAEKQFEKAAALNPENHDYVLAAQLAREHRVTEMVHQANIARMKGLGTKANSLLADAAALDPQNDIVGQHLGSSDTPPAFHPEIEPWMQPGPALAGPITLVPSSGPRSIHVRGDVREVVRQVLSAYDIKPAFDDSVASQNLRIDLDDVPYQQASTIVFEMAHLLAVPLNSQTVLVIKDTPDNRQRYERLLQETIYIPSLTTEQMNEIKTIANSVFDVKQASIQNTSGTLVIRAPQETLTAVNLTLADLLDGGGEVLLDVRLYAVDRTRTVQIGTQLPTQVGIYNVESAAQQLVSANQSLVNQAIAAGLIPANASNIEIALALISSGLVQSTLLSSTLGFFGGGLTATGVTINPATASFTLALNSSDTKSLDNIQLRINDRQTGTFRAGMRYPITTGVYTSGLSGTPSQLAGVTINGISAQTLLSQTSTVSIPQIQYEDLGLTLKATPVVQKAGTVALHLEMKIEALAGTSLNNIPILSSTQYTSDSTVSDGETTLLASSLTKAESAAVSGLPGLGELPGFQTATATKTTQTQSDELLILVTPHIVRSRSNVIAGPRIALNLRQPD